MIIRKAREEDREAILSLVERVFCGEQGIPPQLNPVPEERQPVWWCAVDGSRIIGCIASWHEGGERHFGRYAIEADLRGQGIGTELMRAMMDALFEESDEPVHAEARDTTVHILKKLGAEVTGEAFPFYGADCTPVVMRKEKYRG